jgi:mannose-6-phosphate isomerase-like protein (cupin superfamily)
MQGQLSAFGLAILTPGSSIGYHQHTTDAEAYYIIRGKGRVSDNGTMVAVSPGDMALCAKGDSHSIENTGDEDMAFIALKMLP